MVIFIQFPFDPEVRFYFNLTVYMILAIVIPVHALDIQFHL